MLSYSKKVLPTLSIFFRQKNEIDIYIEDSNDEEFYKALLKRLLRPTIKVDKLISLGCKTKVIDACEADQVARKRKRIYLVDGDLNLLYDGNRKDLEHLFVLDKYCIENFLVDEEAIIEILHDSLIEDKKKIKSSLGMENWLKGISSSLVNLFIHYSICHQFGTGTKTVSTSVGTFCKQERNITVLDHNKVEEFIAKLRDEIVNSIGEERYQEVFYERRLKWPSTIENLLKIVSGKDYIIPLLEFRFKKLRGKESYNLKRETLRMRLAKTINTNTLGILRDELNK